MPVKNNPFGHVDQAKPTEADSLKFFFMCAALAVFERDDEYHERHINILAELDTPNISKHGLETMHRAVISRMHNENDIPATDIKDVVMLSITLLSHMTSTEFHAMPEGQALPN